jgi:hypothetical protein
MGRDKLAWLDQLDIEPRILVALASAQSRYHTALVTLLGDRWSDREIETAVRALQHRQSIELASMGRVRWRVTAQGRSEARRAREAALKKAAA